MNLTILEKDNIYDFISKNKIKFIYKKNEKDKIIFLNFLLKQVSNLQFDGLVECFDYLTGHWDKKCKNDKCFRNRKMIGLFPNRNHFNNATIGKYGIFKFCDSVTCNYSLFLIDKKVKKIPVIG
jgi:hypothetical protein